MTTLTLLSTFPGWPEVDEPSAMFAFTLMFGAPLLIALVVTALIVGTSRRKDLHRNQQVAGMVDDEPRRAVVPARAAQGVEAQDEARELPGGGAHAAPRGV